MLHRRPLRRSYLEILSGEISKLGFISVEGFDGHHSADGGDSEFGGDGLRDNVSIASRIQHSESRKGAVGGCVDDSHRYYWPNHIVGRVDFVSDGRRPESYD